MIKSTTAGQTASPADSSVNSNSEVITPANTSSNSSDYHDTLDSLEESGTSPGTQFKNLARNPETPSQVNLNRVANLGHVLDKVETEQIDSPAPRRSNRIKFSPVRLRDYQH